MINLCSGFTNDSDIDNIIAQLKSDVKQIEAEIKALIVGGALETDEQLPSVRELAMDLSINPNTVQRAYAELERQGVQTWIDNRQMVYEMQFPERAK